MKIKIDEFEREYIDVMCDTYYMKKIRENVYVYDEEELCIELFINAPDNYTIRVETFGRCAITDYYVAITYNECMELLEKINPQFH